MIARSLLGISFPAYRFVISPIQVEVSDFSKITDSSDQLLDIIYSVDPFTRLPKNDISVYLSDKVDPSIRDFISSQLLQPVPKSEGVRDEDSEILHDLVRHDDESPYEYALRVQEIVNNDNDLRIKASQMEGEKSD